MGDEISIKNPKQDQDVVHRHSASYNLFVLVLTLFALAVMVGLIIGHVNYEVLWRIDFLICMIFLIDFSVNLWQAPGRAVYFFKQGGWLDLLGAIPTMLGLPWTSLFRLARLNRLVGIVNYLQGKGRGAVLKETRQASAQTALLTMLIAAFVLITVASLSILWLERDAPGADIKTGRDAFWWAIVTITTVGYGDYVPVTNFGRILAIGLMVFGVGIFAVLTSFVATSVMGLRYDGYPDRDNIVAIIRDENAIVRAELAELKELFKRGITINADGTDE